MRTPLQMFLSIWITGMLLPACSVCKVKLGRTVLKIDKQELTCKCRQLKRNDVLGPKIAQLEHLSALYAVAPVMVKNQKGLYQYYRNTTGARKNRFVYYNGKNVYLVQPEAIEQYIDSLTTLGISHKTINKKLWEVKKSMERKPVGGSDSF